MAAATNCRNSAVDARYVPDNLDEAHNSETRGIDDLAGARGPHAWPDAAKKVNFRVSFPHRGNELRGIKIPGRFAG